MAAAQLIICVGFWPGHMSADTLTQIAEASGEIPVNDQHAALLVWLWSLVWPVVTPGIVLALQVATFLLGAYLIARAAFGRLGASIVSGLLALSPVMIGNLGVLSRDTWFTSLLLLGFGLAIASLRYQGRARGWAFAGASTAAFFCLAARQNAAPAVVVILVALAAISIGPRLRSARRIERVGVPLLAGIGALLALVVVQFGTMRAIGVESVHPQQYLYIYDLAALSVDDGRSLFPRDVYPSGSVATLDQTSSVDGIHPLVFGDNPPIPTPRPDEQVDELRHAWIDEVEGEPLRYLEMRGEAWLHQISLTQKPIWIYHPVIDPNDQGFGIEFSHANDIVTGYQELFADRYLNGGILHRAWIYLLIAIPVAWMLLRRRGALAVVGALAVAAWTLQVGLFFLTPVTQYRFEFPAIACTILATAVLIRTLLTDRRQRAAASF
jgi:hypothetical protein